MAECPDIVEEVARDILRDKGCSIVADEGWPDTIAHHRQMIERYGDVYANSRSLIHDALRDAKAAVTSYERLRRTAPAGEGWQPIEAAPEDDTQILIARQGEWSCQGYRNSEGQYFEFNNHDSDHWGGPMYPTHWKPIPDPPAAEGSSE